jgi:hypothetical protein
LLSHPGGKQGGRDPEKGGTDTGDLAPVIGLLIAKSYELLSLERPAWHRLKPKA